MVQLKNNFLAIRNIHFRPNWHYFYGNKTLLSQLPAKTSVATLLS
jgi:hypothetical protein